MVGFETAAPAWPLPAVPDCDAVGADGRLKSFVLRVTTSDLRLSIGERELGACVLIGLPIREVRSELIRPLEFVFPTWRPVSRPEALRLEPEDEDPPTLEELEDGDETGEREVTPGLEVMLLDELAELVILREGADMLGLDDIEVPGLMILLELVGDCTDRDWLGGLTTLGAVVETLGIRLIGAGLVRPIDGELVGARLMLGDALTGLRLMLGGLLILGAGVGAGAGLATCRLSELPPPELPPLRSGLSPKTGS